MVGNEGMFGVCVFLGSITTPLTAQVQLPGEGLRMGADVLKREFQKCGQLQDLLLRYTRSTGGWQSGCSCVPTGRSRRSWR
jgi:hypothetical protein